MKVYGIVILICLDWTKTLMLYSILLCAIGLYNLYQNSYSIFCVYGHFLDSFLLCKLWTCVSGYSL
jgi:hypothetical protein